ncbi:MAG: hypothetical protein ACRDO2_02615, partial [Nocardioidaceae bacterium]
AEQLAQYLLSDGRTLPAVVVTIPASEVEPYIDADRIADELRDLATVHVMPTRDVSWAFSRAMPERSQVYGGAGRVYPVGQQWADNPHASPLRFAFSAQEGEASTERLINDGLKMASDAGLVGARPQPGLVPASGVVRGLIDNTGRAIVGLDGGRLATIHEELTFPDVPLDRFLRPGMDVMGAYDQRSHRLDIRRMARSVADCLREYGPGDVVLTQVASVSDTRATLLLHPEAAVQIVLEDVTSNPHDRLTELMSPGEVIPARVVQGDPWSLSLTDVEDDERILVAPALLPDGPAWLEQAKPVELLEPSAADAVFASGVPDHRARSVDEVLLDQASTAAVNLTATVQPTPLLMDRNRRRDRTGTGKTEPAPTEPAPGQPAHDDVGRLGAEVPGARAGSEALREKVDFLRVEFAALREERDLVTSRLYAVEQQLAAANATIARHRTELRKTRKRQKEASESPGHEICFLDPRSSSASRSRSRGLAVFRRATSAGSRCGLLRGAAIPQVP